MVELPDFARIVKTLSPGEYPYLALLPRVLESPAVRRIESPTTPIDHLLEIARVRIEPGDGYVWVDDEVPAVILVERYYQRGDPRDLYLDLLHELTHLRQLAEGHSLWNESFSYVDRPTEIEGYAVAIEEGRRLGMTESELLRHLANPWMTRSDVRRLRENVERFLANGGTS
jgi:hypothetical protein